MADMMQNIHRDSLEAQTAALAKATGVRYADARQVGQDSETVLLAGNPTRARADGALPISKAGKRLTVLFSTNILTEDSIHQAKLAAEERYASYAVDAILVSPAGLEDAINLWQTHYHEARTRQHTWYTIGSVDDFAKVLQSTDDPTERTDALLQGAAALRASDLHLESHEQGLRVRLRIDGDMKNVVILPGAATAQLLAEIKYRAGLQLNVAATPQDGRYTEEVAPGRFVDVRISILPSMWGESLAARLLPRDQDWNLDRLLLLPHHRRLVEQTLAAGKGMVITSGPTGSGKTTLLYTLLHHIPRNELTVVSLENPIEYELGDIVQSQIEEHKGYTFGMGLRALLRHDPDVLMVGEVRDEETAHAALQSANTGHLVLTTVHANDALAVPERLRQMGAAAYEIAPALQLVMAQRLLPRACPHCPLQALPADGAMEQLRSLHSQLQQLHPELAAEHPMPDELQVATGCSHCGGTGVAGLLPVVTMYQADGRLRELLGRQAPQSEVAEHLAGNGYLPLHLVGLLHVLQGRLHPRHLASLA